MPSASQTVLLAPTDRAALCARSAERARLFGLETSVATKRHGKGRIAFGRRDHQGCDPDSRADRERQVGDGARDRRARGTASSSTPIPCRSIRCSTCSPRGRRRPISSARRMSSTAMSIPRSPIRPARGCATSRASPAKGGFAGRRPIFVGGTGLYFRALVDGISGCRRSRTMCASAGASELARKRAAGIAPHPAARRPRGSARVEAGRRPAHRARAGGAGGVRPLDQGMAKAATARR